MSYNPNVEVRTYDLPNVAVDVSAGDHGHDHSHAHAADVGFKNTPKGALKWLRKLSIGVIVLSIFQILLTSLHVAKSINLQLNIIGLLAGIAFLIFGILYFRWAKRTKKAGKTGKQKELLQPAEGDEKATKRLFLAGALLTIVAITLGANYYVQRGYNLDVNAAQQTSNEVWTWGNIYNTLRVEQIYKYSYPVLAVFQILFTIYFIFAARTTFRCLKFGNQAITTLVFIGALLTCVYGLNLLFLSIHAQGYDDYPQLETHFPQWVIRSLIAISIAVVALSFLTFLVNHRGWRVGFVLVGLLYIISTLFLVSLVGPSYHHVRKIYQFYNGEAKDSSDTEAWTRLRLVDESQIENWGCPAKYVDASNCALADQVHRWEDYPKTSSSELRTEETASAEATPEAAPQVSTLTFMLEENRVLADTTTTTEPYYCLNTACEGVNGQLYAQPFLDVANWGLLTLLFSGLIVVGTAYFWYVNWVDRARKTSNDYCWALWMAIIALATIFVLIFGEGLPYITEELTTDGKHQ